MTSLAAQLKKLAVPETQVLLSGDLKQASFLYDEGEAAKFDKQHFYNIGINGLQQLVEKDDRFLQFEQNLFSPSSLTLQRYIQNSEVNEKLDATINKFLLMLSPYMQLREAHKAMEWMIHRYNVHLRNVDVLMMCMLPYHDQQPFVMALRLLRMNSNECLKWKWLEPVKKGGSFLPRQSLIQHCKSAKGFLGFLCSLLQSHIEANTDEGGSPSPRHLQRVILFYTQIIIGTLQLGPPSEALLSTLMPSITVGLKNHHLPDLMMSSYMILSQLLTQTDLTKPLLESLVNVITKNIQPNLLQTAITLLIILYQRQNITKLPKKAFKYLCKFPSLNSILVELDKTVKIEPFLSPFMLLLTKRALRELQTSAVTSDSNPEDNEDVSHSSCMTLLVDMLTSVPMDKGIIIAITRELLDWFLQQRSSMELDGSYFQQDGPFKIFKILESRFSKIVESVLQESAENSAELQEIIKDLLEQSVVSAQQDLNSDPMASLVVCLNHRHSGVRQQAVERLLQDVQLLEDKESVQSALTLRLTDEDPSVVAAVLKNPKGLWQLFEGNEVSLYQTLHTKLKVLDLQTKGVKETVINTLCCIPENVANEMELTSIILSYLVPLNLEGLPLVQNIFNSSLAQWHNVLIYLKKCWQPSLSEPSTNIDHLVYIHVKLIDALTAYITTDISAPYNFVDSLCKSLHASPRQECAAFIIINLCENLIQTVGDPFLKSSFQRLLASFVSDLILNKEKKIMMIMKAEPIESCVSYCLAKLTSKGHIPMEIIVRLVDMLDLKVVPIALKDIPFWELQSISSNSIESNWLRTMTLIYSLYLELATFTKKNIKKLAKTCIKKFFQLLNDPWDVLKFLCMIWTSQGVSSKCKALSIQYGKVFLKSVSPDVKEMFLTKATPVLPCLLILMSSKFEMVRHVAIKLLVLLTHATSASSVFIWFSVNLLKYKQEITKDSQFLAQVLKTILEGDLETVCDSPAKKRLRTSSVHPSHLECVHYLFTLISEKNTPINIKCGLLAILCRLDTIESFLPLIPVLNELLEIGENEIPVVGTSLPGLSTEQKALVSMILKRLTPSVAEFIGHNTEAMKTIMKSLQCKYKLIDSGATVQMVLLKQLSSGLLAALPLSSQQCLFTELLNVLSTTNNPEVGRLCRKVVKHMSLDSVIVMDELKTVLSTLSPGTVREAKKKNVPPSIDSTELDTVQWRRIVLLFEMIQSKKKVTNAIHLIPGAFQVLARVLELDCKGSGEYFKQLILGTINFICSRHQKQKENDASTACVKGEHLNMELIVNCIRSSDSPHTHQQALMLLSTAAKIAPSLLLHNMMTVFTFMGANILRQDDAYSFHVIGRILENVIPALILACEEKSKVGVSEIKSTRTRPEEMMTVILRVFVDAIPHIPSHRKIMLFEKLMSIMGADSYLWRLILLFIESVTVRTSKTTDEIHVNDSDQEKFSGPLNVSDLEFLNSMVEKFSCSQLFQSYQKSLSYILDLPEEKENIPVLKLNKESLSLEEMSTEDMEIFSMAHHMEEMSTEDMEIFSMAHHTSKQLRHFKFATIYALNEFISSQHLVSQMATSESSVFLGSYQEFLETVLNFIGQVTESCNKHRDTNSARFWRILVNKSHDVLENLVNLLPDTMFMEVVSGLMDHSLVQRRAMELLNNKLQHYQDNLTQTQIAMLQTMCSKLISIASECLLKPGKKKTKEENLINGQTALYSLKVLSRVFGEKHDQLLQILQLCIQVLTGYRDNGLISSSCLLCVAEVVSCLKLHTIEFVAQFMPLVIGHLKSPAITQHEVLLLAAISSLQKIVESMSVFLSPYLTDVVVQICLISSDVESHVDSHKPTVLQKIKLICTTIATMTPTRIFLPVLEQSFTALEENLASCADAAMTMLKEHIVKMSKEDLTTFSSDLLKFFFTCFDIRSTHDELSDSDLNIIEGCVIEAFLCLVFKLSEAQFKPMLLQIYNWATDEQGNRKRLIVFYRLCDSLAGKLKNLFTLFAGHILKHCADMLDGNNSSKQKCTFFGKGKSARAKVCQMLIYIIDCLQKTFAHDTEGFLTKERFDIVMQPLVDQLENTLGKSSVCEERIVNHVVPCLASLAAAAHDDSLWKDLNYQILLKTRHENYKVRMWALSAIDAFHKQLGEDYTQLVPETIPFMAELMEDESDEVEQCTQKVLAAMEMSVGENLQEYF